MVTSRPEAQVIRFGIFELDLEAGELCKSGVRIKLQEQPFQVLVQLLERPGEIVTREELVKKLWPDGTFVEFDRSLNIAVNKIREALGDSAGSPRFVETVPRRGYRFVAPVEPATGRGAPSAFPGELRKRLPLIGVLTTVLVAVTIWFWPTSDGGGPSSPVLLTSYPGDETYPAFSPDGSEIAFSWNGGNLDNYDIYRKLIGPGETLLRITSDPARDYSPSWSPDGHSIAFLRADGFPSSGTGEPASVVVVSSLGGPERLLADVDAGGLGSIHPPSHKLAWSPNARWLVVPDRDSSGRAGLFLVSVKTGEKRRLTSGNDVGPAMSPDGRSIAFCRIGGVGLSDLYVLSLTRAMERAGKLRRINGEVRATASPAWTGSGESVVFGGSRRGVRTLWSVSVTANRSPEMLPVGERAAFVAVAPQADRLAYASRVDRHDIWRVEVDASGDQRSAAVQFISSTQQELFPRFSPDGRQIAFQSSRSGLQQVWVCNEDGSQLRQLTFIDQGLAGSPRWSPDGKRIAFDSNSAGQYFQIYWIGAEGGPAHRLTDNARHAVRPAWSRDGKWIYFADLGFSGQVWKVPSEGGPSVQVTTQGGGGTIQESSDGQTLYYGNLVRLRCLWSAALDSGTDSQVLESANTVSESFLVVERGIYHVPAQGIPSIRFLHFQTGEIKSILTLGPDATGGFSVSPDERTLLFVRRHPPESDLILVENYR